MLNCMTPRALPCSEITTDVTADCLDTDNSLMTLSASLTSADFSSWTDVMLTMNVFDSSGSVFYNSLPTRAVQIDDQYV